MSGLFISFEGGEGSGKTTQINKLAAFLTQQGHRVVTTREPGGTEEGDKLRNLLVQRDGGDWGAMAEALLLYAARHIHAEQIIRPALAEGKVVISDRFADSTTAYQGYGRGLDLKKIKSINDTVLDGLRPDLTIILDIDPEIGLPRSERRLASEKLGADQSEDKFERLDLDFHEKMRQGFLSIAKQEPDRCRVLDATLEIEELGGLIQDIVKEKLG